MTTGDLLRKLFLGYVRHDDVSFRIAAETIIEEERSKNHRLLADDLDKILMNDRQTRLDRLSPRTQEIPKDRERGLPLVHIKEFRYDWDRLVLSPQSLNLLKQVAEEYNRQDLLASVGLKPKRRVLFYGPPGCGKTLAAQVLSAVLGYPLVTVRVDTVVSSYLGETSANLRKIFDFIDSGKWVVLFDEFDSIAKDRDNPLEHGELKRVVNTLIQMMDASRSDNLLIAATNHHQLLDDAIWRRFEAIIPFGPPSPQERLLLLELFLKGFESGPLNLRSITRRIQGATGADIEWITVESVKRAILDGRHFLQEADVDVAVRLFRDRIRVMNKVAMNGQGPNDGSTNEPP